MADAKVRGAAVVTDGKVGCAALLWRYRGRPQLTVVVKAAFAISHGAVARYLGPASIADADVTFGRNPARSVETASDLAFYKPRCDVTLIGHGCAPAGRQSRPSRCGSVWRARAGPSSTRSSPSSATGPRVARGSHFPACG